MTDPAPRPSAAGPLGERLFVLLQHALPQHPLSRVVHGLTRLPAGPLTRVAVAAFIRAYGVDMQEAT